MQYLLLLSCIWSTLEWNILQQAANTLKCNGIKEWTLIPTSSSIKLVGIHRKPSEIMPLSGAALSAVYSLYCKSFGSWQQNQSSYNSTEMVQSDLSKDWISVLWSCISLHIAPPHLILPFSQWQLVLSNPLTSTSLPVHTSTTAAPSNPAPLCLPRPRRYKTGEEEAAEAYSKQRSCCCCCWRWKGTSKAAGARGGCPDGLTFVAEAPSWCLLVCTSSPRTTPPNEQKTPSHSGLLK